MTNNELQRRLEALERRLNSSEHRGESSQPLRVVVVYGCLPPGIPLWATAGSHEWFPDAGEGLEAFGKRAAAAARALKETLLVLGGLPSTQTQTDVALAAYDAWLLTDDGVPPVERGRGLPA
ncbi:hypothetical protein QCM80_22860 [Bradyrhizobium sp. SSUT112]|uniref:hypothetical protein n=1 Tax=Bradyrhizobium sp. SSUT112 TaxID=3040604 RepID=UPI002448BC4E|nr:hypothetical protein [Bradyrhizobium sp. SSUT112]MDH2353479.1 hypothetical protein [Bradyrhizobium sp. SSUT112]